MLVPNLWNSLHVGGVYVFGMLQFDTVGHSALEGSIYDIQETKNNLAKHVSAILSVHDGALLNWAGDGGAYLFLMKDPQSNDAMVTGALQILDGMPFFR